MKAIVNGKVLIGQAWESNTALVFDDTILALVSESQLEHGDFEEIIDAKGCYVSPGFIDLHVHGCSGADTMDEDEKALNTISMGLAATGVTSFLPTTMTMEFSRIEDALRRIRRSREIVGGAQILGCHLEGPFINKKYKGAQDEQYILRPDFSLLEDFKDIIRIVTMAPELDGSKEFIEACRLHNIVVSLGHSNATYDEAKEAFHWGIGHLTHTFNAMPPFHHRLPGPVGAAVESDNVICELIADNIHVHPVMQRILLRLKGQEKVILITDAMRACLLGEGRYDLGGQMVNVKEGTAKLDNGTIAGSTLRLHEGVRNFAKNSGVSLAQVIQLVTSNPAQAIKIDDHKGSLTVGKDADIIIFDANVSIIATFVRGKKVYGRENECGL